MGINANTSAPSFEDMAAQLENEKVETVENVEATEETNDEPQTEA